jgi:hypothetical protein
MAGCEQRQGRTAPPGDGRVRRKLFFIFYKTPPHPNLFRHNHRVSIAHTHKKIFGKIKDASHPSSKKIPLQTCQHWKKKIKIYLFLSFNFRFVHTIRFNSNFSSLREMIVQFVGGMRAAEEVGAKDLK